MMSLVLVVYGNRPLSTAAATIVYYKVGTASYYLRDATSIEVARLPTQSCVRAPAFEPF